jgi:microcompartment protein CcmL/EutN
MHPALLLLEFDSIAVGIEAGDAMAKRSQLGTLRAGTVQPGRYLVLACGEVADVEEARAAGLMVGEGSLVDEVFLPDVHPEVVTALVGGRRTESRDALGIIETRTVAATIGAADAGVKGADVSLIEIRLADGLGGKAYVLFSGAVSDVEAAVEVGVASLVRRQGLVARVVIPQIHGEMLDNLHAHPQFRSRLEAGQPTARGAG